MAACAKCGTGKLTEQPCPRCGAVENAANTSEPSPHAAVSGWNRPGEQPGSRETGDFDQGVPNSRRGGLRVDLYFRPDGGLRVSSPDEPGLILSGADCDKVMAAIIPALGALASHRNQSSRRDNRTFAHMTRKPMMDHFQKMYLDVVEAFDKDKTAAQFLREDGEGGFRAGVYRMAREIERLWMKCGEPAERDPKWQDKEDIQIDAAIDAMMAAKPNFKDFVAEVAKDRPGVKAEMDAIRNQPKD